MARDGLVATLETTALVVLVFVVQLVGFAVGFGPEFVALSLPLEVRPWTIVTSVYAHAGVGHLLTNLVGLLVFGVIVARRSTRLRFHLFVLVTGALAGIAEVLVGAIFGFTTFVLGISGAVFALMGYVLASNPLTDSALDWLEVDTRIQLVLMVILAVAITWMTGGERVALVAHFTGFVLGLVSGRLHLLRA